MNLLEFNKHFTCEGDCERYLKEHREKEGLTCTSCGCQEHYWDKHNKRWICKKCGHETTLTSNESDGEANTKVIMDFAKSKGALAKFPIYQWCSKLGEGWYVPSHKELESFVNYWLGNEQTIDWDSDEDVAFDDSKPYYKTDNAKIVEAGGVPFLNGVFTSTVNSDNKVYVFYYNRQKNVFSFKKWSKDNLSKYFVGRAFRKF